MSIVSPADSTPTAPGARPRRRLLFLLPVVVFIGGVVFLALGLTRDPGKLPSPLIDQPAPAFSLPPVPGRDDHGFSSKDLGGKLMIVNVFASWCVPCRLEAPMIQRLAKERGITVQGIAYKDKAADVKAWLAELGDPFTRIGLDSSGRTAIDWGVLRGARKLHRRCARPHRLQAGGPVPAAGFRRQDPAAPGEAPGMRRLVLALLVVLAALPALAAVSPDEMLPDPALEARARNLEKGLRCLVCQNQSIDDSDADLARDIRTLVRQQILEGRTDQEIEAYLVSRYGDFVLLQPPVTSATWALWFGPLLMLLLGSGLLIAFVRRRAAEASGVPELSQAEEQRLIELLSDEGEERGR